MSSYKEVLKSSGLIAFVQVFQLFFGVLRNKFVAVFLGATGLGYWGLYQTFIEMFSAFSTLGVEQSGVREISKNSPDTPETIKVILVLKQLVLVLSVVSMLITIIFCKQISKSLFGTEENFWGIIIISVAILLNGITKGQKATLNGLRRLRHLAISQIWGTILGSIITIVLIYFFRLDGLPIYFLCISIFMYISFSFFLTKNKIPNVAVVNDEKINISKKLISLGLGFSLSAIIAAFSTYLSRIYLNYHFDIKAVGIYQASWTISNLYIGIILSAMGVDFMPRLTKIIDRPTEVSKLINEQMEFGALITSLGVVLILFFSLYFLEILYSKEFVSGVEIIRWQILGVSLRVLGYPFSYAIMAKREIRIYIGVQAIFWVSDLLLIICFSKLFGFDGLGVNYFISYLGYLVITWIICKKLCGFSPSVLLKKIIIVSYCFIIFAWITSRYLKSAELIVVGVLTIIAMVFWINLYLKKYMNLSLIKIIKSKISK